MVPTARTEDKVKMYRQMGFQNTVQFDLGDPNTWENLPAADSVIATIVTFAMDISHAQAYEELWSTRLNCNAPIICLGTSSLLFAAGSESVNIVDEDSPLSGVGVRGNSLGVKDQGEAWAARQGAVILHLSGICGDEIESEGHGVGATRYVGDFARKGYLRNGLKLINLIHIADIAVVVASLISDWVKSHSGKRILVSSGAYMSQDIVQLCGLEPIPTKPFPDPSMVGNKIIHVTLSLDLSC